MCEYCNCMQQMAYIYNIVHLAACTVHQLQLGFLSIAAHIVFTEFTSCPTVSNMKMVAD
jgi:hypothetical protein